MAVEPKISITMVLVDLNLPVQYRIAIYIIICESEILACFNLVVAKGRLPNRQISFPTKISGYTVCACSQGIWLKI